MMSKKKEDPVKGIFQEFLSGKLTETGLAKGLAELNPEKFGQTYSKALGEIHSDEAFKCLFNSVFFRGIIYLFFEKGIHNAPMLRFMLLQFPDETRIIASVLFSDVSPKVISELEVLDKELATKIKSLKEALALEMELTSEGMSALKTKFPKTGIMDFLAFYEANFASSGIKLPNHYMRKVIFEPVFDQMSKLNSQFQGEQGGLAATRHWLSREGQKMFSLYSLRFSANSDHPKSLFSKDLWELLLRIADAKHRRWELLFTDNSLVQTFVTENQHFTERGKNRLENKNKILLEVLIQYSMLQSYSISQEEDKHVLHSMLKNSGWLFYVFLRNKAALFGLPESINDKSDPGIKLDLIKINLAWNWLGFVLNYNPMHLPMSLFREFDTNAQILKEELALDYLSQIILLNPTEIILILTKYPIQEGIQLNEAEFKLFLKIISEWKAQGETRNHTTEDVLILNRSKFQKVEFFTEIYGIGSDLDQSLDKEKENSVFASFKGISSSAHKNLKYKTDDGISGELDVLAKIGDGWVAIEVKSIHHLESLEAANSKYLSSILIKAKSQLDKLRKVIHREGVVLNDRENPDMAVVLTNDDTLHYMIVTDNLNPDAFIQRGTTVIAIHDLVLFRNRNWTDSLKLAIDNAEIPEEYRKSLLEKLSAENRPNCIREVLEGSFWNFPN